MPARRPNASRVWLVGANPLLLVGCLAALAAALACWQAARRAAASAAWQAALLEQVHDAVLVYELGGGIVYWNRAAQDLYGWSAEEAIGRDIHDLLGTRPRGMPDMKAVEAILSRADNWAGELEQRRRDGRPLVCESRLSLVRHDKRRALVLEANHDVTERERMEQACRLSEARLRALVDTAVDAIITIDDRGQVLSFNQAAEQLFQYRAEEVVGRDVNLLMPDPLAGEHGDYLARYRSTGDRRVIGREREVTARRKDGTLFPIELAVGQADLGGRRFFTGIVRDLTDKKRVEAEREELLESERAARSEAERAARMKDEFLATLSHELRTPLTAIVGWVRLLVDRRLDADAAAKALRIIERNVRALTQMIEDLLDVSRIVSGKLRVDTHRLDLAEVVESAVGTLQPTAAAKHVRVEKQLDRGPIEVLGDASRLQQVVWNLLSNAIKFTGDGGLVRVTLRRTAARAEVAVSDTGQGIAKDFLPHVFERFRQADSSTTRPQRGLGLGLALVKQLVELHGGSVRAESEGEGKGATFTVELPLAGRAEAGARAAHLRDPCASLAGVKVLVVDDDEDTRELVGRVLADCGAEVIGAGSAAEALEAVQRHRPDVMLSDIGMPQQDGYQLVRALRALAPEDGGSTPAAALTAFTRPEDRERALRAGYQVHVAKPVNASALIDVVASIAAGVAARRGDAA
jgi:PAS domain S-box-containing protein